MRRYRKILFLFIFTVFCGATVFIAEAALPLWGRHVKVDHTLFEKRQRIEQSAALAHYIVALIKSNHGDATGAIEEYHRALRYAPGEAAILTRLGADLLLLGRTEDAMGYLEQAVQAAPGKVEPYLLMAIVYTSKGEYEKAESHFLDALEKDLEDEEKILSMLADVYMLQKDLKKAAGVYERLAKMRARPAGYFNLGVLYTKIQELGKAADSLEKAVELDGNHLDAQLALGYVYQISGAFPRAIEQYEQVLELEPAHMGAHMRLAALFHKLGMHEKALAQNALIRDLAPDQPQGYINAAHVHISLGQAEEAEAVLREALENDVTHPSVFAIMGYMALTGEDHEGAVDHYRKALDAAGGDDPLYAYYLAMALYESDEVEQAIGLLERILETGEAAQLPRIYNFLGYAYAERGENLEEAVQLIKKALDAEPDNAAYIDSLGWAYFMLGEYEKAVIQLERAARLMPEEAIILEHYAEVLEKLGKLDKALEQWRHALEQDEGNQLYKERIQELERKLR